MEDTPKPKRKSQQDSTTRKLDEALKRRGAAFSREHFGTIRGLRPKRGKRTFAEFVASESFHSSDQ